MKIELEIKKEMIQGTKVVLTDEDIVRVHTFFERECMLEFVRENNLDWTNEKIEFVAGRAYEIHSENVREEDEQNALSEAEKEWEEQDGKEIRN